METTSLEKELFYTINGLMRVFLILGTLVAIWMLIVFNLIPVTEEHWDKLKILTPLLIITLICNHTVLPWWKNKLWP